MISSISMRRLWGLWDMIQSYLPIYQITVELERLRSHSSLLNRASPSESTFREFRALLENIIRECPDRGLIYTAELAKRLVDKPQPETYDVMAYDLKSIIDLLGSELEKEAVFRIPPERKDYFERPDLFGPEVSDAFPSCAYDIERAGSCYALGQGDASVHHLMLVLERGLHALAAKVSVIFHGANWQEIIDRVGKELKSFPRGAQRDFYTEVNSQFGFLKDTYRNYSQHVHDIPYDTDSALSTLNHVRRFMQALQKGGLSE
jgi:hypothetical protein